MPGQSEQIRQLYAEVQAAKGSPATIVDADAVKSTGANWGDGRYAGERVALEYDKMELGNDRELNVNPHSVLGGFTVAMAGSGARETAPAWGKLIRGCCCAETEDNTAITSGTATSGTSTTLVDTGASRTPDADIGKVLVITGGTGSGQERIITDNDATSWTVATWDTNPDATSEYEVVDGEFQYTPIDTGFEYLTCVLAEQFLQQQSEDMLGNFGLTCNPLQMPVFNMSNLMGTYKRAVTLALTSPDNSAYQNPVPVSFGNTGTLTLDGNQYPIGGFTFDAGNQLVFDNKPGLIGADLTGRASSGSIIVMPESFSEFAAIIAKVESHNGVNDVPIELKHGTGIGSAVGLSIPACNLGDMRRNPINGRLYYAIPFKIVKPSSGAQWTLYQGNA